MGVSPSPASDQHYRAPALGVESVREPPNDVEDLPPLGGVGSGFRAPAGGRARTRRRVGTGGTAGALRSPNEKLLRPPSDKPFQDRTSPARVKGPTIRFLGGVREIGGNKILIEDGPDRILFDFGPSFSPRAEEYYVDYLQPRSTCRAKDLLEFDLIPRISGLYAKETLGDGDLEDVPPEIHGIFVSHAHADHAGYLELVDPSIPVYVGEGTRTLLSAIEKSTRMKYGDHPWNVFTDRQPIRVGGIEVVPYPVDHSIPFAYGFLVRTREGTIAYTGDFRHHGPRAPDTHAFFEAVAAEKVEALVIEGTRAGPDPRRNLSEAGVRAGVDRVLNERPELALACTYPRDIDRLRTLHAAAVAADRDLVVSVRTALLLSAVAGRSGRRDPGARPRSGAPGLRSEEAGLVSLGTAVPR